MEPLRQTARGHYKILEKIGEGSLGVVYLAEDTESGKNYALKTLRERGSVSGEDLERVRGLFLNEADAGSVLSHPGVTKIHDVVEDPLSGELYLVLEYVSGSSLAERLARPDPLPFDFVSKVVCQVADVLDYVHARGIVHRDIKPANILIDEEGTIKITDFGISELQREDLALELQRAGSPNYMAPERVLGTGADHRADIWALGVVLYEMTTRNLPFRGESVGELIQNVAAEEPPPLSAYNPFAIPGLQPIVDKALSKEPEDRYQQAGELAEELRLVQLSQLSLSATLPATAIPELGAPEREALTLEEIFASDSEASHEHTPAAPEAVEESAASAGATAWTLPSWRPGRRAVAAAAVGFALLLLMFLAAAPGPDAPAPSEPAPSKSAPSEPAAAVPPQIDAASASSEYLALLEDARRLYAKGQEAEASTLLARAAAMSPAGSRIHVMREDARKQAAEEVAAEVDRDVAAWIGIAQADLDEGHFQDAREAAERVLDLDSEHTVALALVAEVEDQRRLEQRRQRDQREPPKPTVVIERLPLPAPKPVQIAEPVPKPAPVVVPQFADLKVDFHSELPRGVVTVYLGESQVLRRPFRFVEKKGFMRSRGTSGGFDEQIRVDAGPGNFRVYLSLPGRETQVQRLSGLLPAGAVHALRVRVEKDGAMTVSLQ